MGEVLIHPVHTVHTYRFDSICDLFVKHTRTKQIYSYQIPLYTIQTNHQKCDLLVKSFSGSSFAKCVFRFYLGKTYKEKNMGKSDTELNFMALSQRIFMIFHLLGEERVTACTPSCVHHKRRFVPAL